MGKTQFLLLSGQWVSVFDVDSKEGADADNADIDADGAKMGDIELINTALVQSSKEGGLAVSPTFQQVRK